MKTRTTDTKKTGTLYGVGVGPGDPELMTLKAIRALNACPVIAVPKSSGESANGALRALSIAGGAVDLKAKEIAELLLPMTKDGARLKEAREKAASVIAARLKKGVDVAFITLGDPMLYSTFSHIVPFVRELLPDAGIKVIPGVTSFCAAAACAGFALAESGEKVAIIPAAYSIEDLRERILASDTVILMKVNRAMDALIDLLCSMGLEKNSVFVSRASWPDEEIVRDIKTLRGASPGYFSTVIIRK